MEGSVQVTDDGLPTPAVAAPDAAALARRVELLEAELKHSRQAERDLRQALSSASLSFHTCDPAGETLWTSALLPELLGLPQEAVLGRPLSDFLVDPLLLELLLTRLHRGESVREWPAALRRPDGGLRHVLLGATPVLQDGRLERAVCFMQDVTESLRLRDALQQQTLRLNLAERRRDALLATLGHELRNRLTVIDTALALSRRGDGSGGREAIARQVELLDRLVGDLLDAEQLRAGTLALRREPVALSLLLQQATEMARRMVDGNAHLIAAEPPAEDAVVHGDAERLAQALARLLVHAARQAPGSGGITLGAGSELGTALIWIADDGDRTAAAPRRELVPLAVAAGHGESAFEPGPALALLLARRIVELHGGGLEVQRQDGAPGIRFLVRLPLVEPAGAAGGGLGGTAPMAWSGNNGTSRAAAQRR